MNGAMEEQWRTWKEQMFNHQGEEKIFRGLETQDIKLRTKWIADVSPQELPSSSMWMSRC